MVAGRFIITLKGRNIDEEGFKAAIDELNIKSLAKME